MPISCVKVASGGLAVSQAPAGLGAPFIIGPTGIAVTVVASRGIPIVDAGTGLFGSVANTTWSPTDKTASMGLSSGNLRAAPSGSNAAVRATGGLQSGKYYFEYTSVVATQLNDFFGLADAAISLPSGSTVQATAGTVGLSGTTVAYVNGAALNSGGQIGTSAPPYVYIAIDLSAGLIWFKVSGISGSGWNSGGTADPSTGAGGYSISALSGKTLVPYCGFIATGTQLTANFGASAFAGTVPSGFTAGWPT